MINNILKGGTRLYYNNKYGVPLYKKKARKMDPVALGMQAASGLVDTGLGLLMEGHNDRRQLRQEGKLLRQQAEVDRGQTQFNQQIGLDTWRKTGPVGMTEELKKAGLSPALQYGMGGSGGQSMGAPGGSVGGGKSPKGGGEVMGMAMMNAQRALIEAQTKNVEVDTENKAGVDRELKRAQGGLIGVQTEQARIENNMKTDTYEVTKGQIEAAADKMRSEAGIAANNREISDKTKKNQIDMVEGELIGLTLANELKRAQTGLAEEQIKKVIQDVKQGWQRLSIESKNAATNLMNSETARINANTSIREFLEHVRKTDYDYDVRRGALELQRWLHDMPDSEKITVEALQNVLGTGQRKATKQEK